MAHVSRDFRKQYPQTSFAVLELRDIPSTKPKVFKHFLSSSKLSKIHAISALSSRGKDGGSRFSPEFIIKQRSGSYAYYPGAGNTIWLGPVFVEQYEDFLEEDIPLDFIDEQFSPSIRLQEGVLRKKRDIVHDKARLLMESKLLHEMVHWARSIMGNPTGGSKRGSTEVGWMFERNAYGKELDAKSLELLENFH